MRTALDVLVRARLGLKPDHVLVYNNYDLTEGSVLLFLFRGKHSSPFAVIKLSRSRSVLFREYENLRFMEDTLPGIAAAPLFFDEVEEYHALCTAPLPANRLIGREAQFRMLRCITDRIAELHVQLKAISEKAAFTSEEFFEPFAALQQTEMPARTADYFKELATEYLPMLDDYGLPRIPQHGDLYFDNILARGRRIYFLDWEDFGDIRLPGYDLFSLVFDLLRLQELDMAAADQNLSRVAGPTSGYFRKMDIPFEAAGALMLFTLVQQYYRSWRQGRTSTRMFERRLEVLVNNRSLLRRMIDAYAKSQ